MPSFGNLFASLTLESASFMSGVKAAQKELRETQKTFAAVGAKMQGIGALMTVGITAPFLAASRAATEGALAQRQAMAQVTAALESMGPAAGRTAEQLSKTADALEANSMVDADVILTKITANLLTFGNVAGTVFDRAQQSAIDMAQRLGQDPQAAAVMLGKALNDPVKGITALTRVGVSFSASQIEMIKQMAATGQTAKAQGLILTEVERQFGGAAAAAANTDPYRQMNVALGQMSDVLGEVVLEMLPSVTAAIKGIADAFLSLPQPAQTGLVAIVAVGAVLGPVIAAFGTLVTGIGALLPVLATLQAVIMSQAIPAIIAFMTTLAPILLPIAAVAAAIAGIVLVIRNWDKIQPYVDKVVGWMGDLYRGVKTWVLDKLGAVWDGVRAGIDKVKGFFFGLYDAVVGHSYVPDMVTEIGQHMARLNETLVKPAQAATKTAAQAFADLQQKVGPILDRLFPNEAGVNRFREEMDALAAYAKQGKLTADQLAEAQRRLRLDASGLGPEAQQTGGVQDPLAGANVDVEGLGKTVEDVWGRVRAANDNTVQSFAGMARDIVGSLGNLGRSIKSGDWLGALQGVLDTIGQIAGLINGTGQPATRTFSTGLSGARAMGGPVMPRGSYLVGERGPEILRMGGRGGSIVPNNEIGGATTVHVMVEEGSLFRPVVRSESASVTYEAVNGNNRTSALRNRQALA